MVPGTKVKKKKLLYFVNWVILNRKIQKKNFSSINAPPRPPLAPRTRFSEKFCVCYFCELGDSEPEN